MDKIKQNFKIITNKLLSLKLTTPIAIILGSIMISSSVIAYGFIVRVNASQNNEPIIFTGKSIDDKELTKGNLNSKVIVVEYSDTECPFCIYLHPTMKQLRLEYADRVKFAYRHFPLTRIHKQAFDESKAIYCAGKVGGAEKYFKYIDTLFDYKSERQTETNTSPALPINAKESFANEIGLSASDFTKCIGSDFAKKEIENSINDGINAGVQGTPATFILVENKNGYEVVSMIDGARDIAFFKAAIDEALRK